MENINNRKNRIDQRGEFVNDNEVSNKELKKELVVEF